MKILKVLPILIILGLLTSCSCGPQKPGNITSEEELLKVVQQAVNKKDVATIMKLGHWSNVPQKMEDGMRRHIPDCFDYQDPKFSLREMTPKEREPVQAASGKTYTWNMQPVGYLVVEGSNPGDGSLSIPFGKLNGKYYITTRLPK